MSGFGASRYIPMSYFDSLADARKTLKENSLTSLEFQTDLREWMDRSVSLVSYQHFMRVYGYKQIEDEEARRQLGAVLHGTVKSVVSTASTFYVSPDMCELVKMAAEDMPVSGLKPTDLPADTGFLVFDRPVALTSELPCDLDDGSSVSTAVETRIAAIAWQAGTVKEAPVRSLTGQAPGFVSDGQTVPGVSYFLFCTPHDTAVQLNLTAQQCNEEPTTDEDEVRRANGPLPIYDFSGWSYNTPWLAVESELLEISETGRHVPKMTEGAQEAVTGVHSIVDQTRRLMLATWRILNQENVVVRDPNKAPRQMRRRAERVGVPETGDIVIIRMRREVYQGLKKAAGGEDEEPWYTIRFMVRGHWHNYWVGPRGNQHLISKYLLPYEKGPEGAPLVVKDKIFSLER
ncbi:MAG TPA: hypothetical protein VFI41_05220 [Gemmatimonadales bacterium]|nr:hypothetical protein [Gemmatimonadales bacterium]